jgi:hypothetical protein
MRAEAARAREVAARAEGEATARAREAEEALRGRELMNLDKVC